MDVDAGGCTVVKLDCIWGAEICARLVRRLGCFEGGGAMACKRRISSGIITLSWSSWTGSPLGL